ncbi:hypothetical protein D915_000460 [Fasciola hepatica]|nr:hypothetical protein D915_000460 [Fasciola hepatica]
MISNSGGIVLLVLLGIFTISCDAQTDPQAMSGKGRCHHDGHWCQYDWQCCGRMKCDARMNKCRKQCAGKNDWCNSNSDCCGPMDCRRNRCKNKCESFGESCEKDWQCCYGMKCNPWKRQCQ